MNRRGLLTGTALAATATLITVPRPAQAVPQTVPAVPHPVPPADRPRRVIRPCPVWCEEDHSPNARLKFELEESCQERWHTACLGYDADEDLCVELTRVDHLYTGESAGERVSINLDDYITPDAAEAVSRLTLAARDILAGRLTVAQWRATSGLDYHSIEMVTAQ